MESEREELIVVYCKIFHNICLTGQTKFVKTLTQSRPEGQYSNSVSK